MGSLPFKQEQSVSFGDPDDGRSGGMWHALQRDLPAGPASRRPVCMRMTAADLFDHPLPLLRSLRPVPRGAPLALLATGLIAALLQPALSAPSDPRAAGPVSTAAAPAASAARASPATRSRRYTLGELAGGQPLRFSGADHSIALPLSVRLDETVVSARLRLTHTFSPALLPQQSQLRLLLNEEAAGVLPALEGRLGSAQTVELPIEPTLFTEFARLRLQFLGHYASDCPQPLHSSLWAQIDPASTLELVTRPLELADDLALLPAPFFDRRDATALTLPLVLPARPSLELLRSAGVLASWFGALADYRPARFPVHVDDLPARHALVLATNRERPAGLALPQVEVPTLAMRSHPRDPATKLLLLLGRDSAQLRSAVEALVLATPAWSGPQAQPKALERPSPRAAWDSPRVAGPGRQLRAAEMVTDPQQLQVRGQYLPPITLQWRLPPDRLAWPGSTVPVTLRYRYTPPGPGVARLVAHLNGRFVQAVNLPRDGAGTGDAARLLPFLERGGRSAGHTLHLPTHLLASDNRLELSFELPAAETGRCHSHPPEAQAALDPASTLDLRGLDLYTEMPDLAHFATAGYPFSRHADLGQTALILPDRPEAADIEAMLRLLARLGAATGLPATELQLLPASRLPEAGDRDLLVVAGPQDRPWLRAWAEALPVQPDGELAAQAVRRRVAAGQAQWLGAPQAAVWPTGWGQDHAGAPAWLMGFASPLHAGRSVILLAGDDATARARLLEQLLDPRRVARVQGDLLMLRGERLESFRLGERYHSGSLPAWRRLWFHLQDRVLLLGGLALLAVLAAALLAQSALRRRAERRLALRPAGAGQPGRP